MWKQMGAVGRRVTFRPGARVGTIAASLAAAASLLLPNTVLAATVIGSAQGTFSCSGFSTGDYVQASSSGSSYVVPSGGTSITSWSVLAGDDTGPVALLVWRPTAPPVFTLVGLSPSVTLTPNTLNDIPLTEAISVQPGDLLGLRLEGAAECAQLTGPDDTVGYSFGAFGTLNAPLSMIVGGGFQLNIAATTEVASPPPPPPTPTTADQCKHGGWQGLTDSQGTLFKNQGDCVSFVATKGTNLAAGSAP
jgi:hypothetical protein